MRDAFTLLPAHAAGSAELLPRLGVLSLLIVMVSGIWVAAGASLKRRVAPQTGSRAGAIALVIFAGVIGASAISLAGG